MKKITGRLILVSILFITVSAPAQDAAKEASYQKVKDYVSTNKTFRYALSSEGEFVAVFNEDVSPWIEKKLDMPALTNIQITLAAYLHIKLNEKGFASAAPRDIEGGRDETHYDAIWVRDNVWVYYSLLKDPGRRDDARKLLLALWDYYSTDEQTTRFSNIIKNPVFAGDPMEMPHIRFDSNSTNLGDVIVDGKPEVWNHRQIDAHGLFFTALAEAVGNKIIDHNDLTVKRFKVLSLYPLFLEKIKFYYYEDAGAWEELPRKNTSSIGLATRSLQVWKKLLYNDTSSEAKAFRRRFDILSDKKDKKITKAWSDGNLQKLIENGLKTVRRQLFLGGESPDYKTDDIHFRLADAALGVLIVPSTLDGISEEELRKALLIIETLKRPAGILRYDNDSYQGGNYWIQKPGQTDKDKPTLTGDTSSKDAFLWRLSKLIPDTEAEWFFDSFVALSYLRLAEITKNTKLKEEDLHFAVVHLKRALGQITGKSIASDGKSVRPWQTPESINTVVIDDHRYYLPSPITPLNWAKASLSMALKEYEKALKRQP